MLLLGFALVEMKDKFVLKDSEEQLSFLKIDIQLLLGFLYFPMLSLLSACYGLLLQLQESFADSIHKQKKIWIDGEDERSGKRMEFFQRSKHAQHTSREY
mmetsp:Transcript_33293/g.80495  ORF Transcript_33293/g.80495 Transcript_33293/m.80495 type:complete len:100 (-) Transcript_33293:114-413(-)